MATEQSIALQRIRILFKEARESFNLHPERSHRYVKLARKMAMKVNLKLPLALKRRYCNYCYHFLQPGANSRVRTRKGKLIIYCMHCKKYKRITLNPK